MLFLRMFKNLLLALHGGQDPRHLAAGFALGACFGLVPKGNLLGVLFFVLFFFLRVDKGMALVSAAVFTPLALAFDGPAHKLGWALLSAPSLAGLWTALYDLPIVPLTRFNNTVVLGNLVIGLALAPFLYMGFLRFVAYYGLHLKARVEAIPLVRAVKGWGVWDYYHRYSSMYREWLG